MKFVDDYKNIRLPDYDYNNGWFFITNKTNNSFPYLTKSIHDIVKTELEEIHKICQGVSLDYATIVPTHVHCILILGNSKLSLSEIWRRFKARTTYFTRKNKLINGSLWQRNYYEHAVRSEKALERIREYIRNNPLKEGLDLNEIYSLVPGTMGSKGSVLP
jgi:putative transposase